MPFILVHIKLLLLLLYALVPNFSVKYHLHYPGNKKRSSLIFKNLNFEFVSCFLNIFEQKKTTY